MSAQYSQYWKSLSPGVRFGLLQGSVGKQHCLDLARLALEECNNPGQPSSQQLINFSRQMLLHAWEQTPLNGDLAASVLQLAQGQIQASLQKLLEAVAQNWKQPAPNDPLPGLVKRGDYERCRAHIQQKMQDQPENLYWQEQLWELCWHDNELAELKKIISSLYVSPALALLADYLEAKRLIAEFAGSCSSYQNLPDTALLEESLKRLQNPTNACREDNQDDNSFNMPLKWLAPAELAAHSLSLLGEQDESINLRKKILKHRPWHTSLALALSEQVRQRVTILPPPGRITVLLYSFNKASDLDATISALAPDAPRLFKIVALNNGSSDNTDCVLAAWQEKLGNELFNRVSLPVNVGAPAARNWLMTHEAVSESTFTIYLDDDALVNTTGKPGNLNWLDAFGASVAAYPEAAAYGLKIIDHAAPHLAQSVDLHVLPPEDFLQDATAVNSLANALENGGFNNCPAFSGYSLNRANSRSFSLQNLAQAAPDFGYFDYIRPCASVTGCCHMFRSKSLVAGGNFNLSFSPSQYDDLERDLRHAADGQFSAYTGLGGVYHLQRTGRGSRNRRMSPATFGTGLANHYKLFAHFNAERVFKIMQAQFKLLEEDLLGKLAMLEQPGN